MEALNIILCHWCLYNDISFYKFRNNLVPLHKLNFATTHTEIVHLLSSRLAFRFHWGISLIRIKAAGWEHLVLRVLTLTANSITRFQIRSSDFTHHSSSVLCCHSQSQPLTFSLFFNVEVGKGIICTSVENHMLIPHDTLRTSRCFNKQKLLLVSQWWLVGVKL